MDERAIKRQALIEAADFKERMEAERKAGKESIQAQRRGAEALDQSPAERIAVQTSLLATKAGISGEDAASPVKLLNALYKKSETLLDTATNGKTERERVTAQNDIVKMAQSGVLGDATALVAQEQAQKKAAEQEASRKKLDTLRSSLDLELALLEKQAREGTVTREEYEQRRRDKLETRLKAEYELDPTQATANRQNIERMQLDDELAAKRREAGASRIGEYRPTDEIRRIGGTLGSAVGNINGQKQLNATLTTNRLLQIIAQNQKNATGGGAATFLSKECRCRRRRFLQD